VSRPTASTNAPPVNPPCISADVRMISGMARPRPVGSGPPTIETTPRLAVRPLLHERPIANERCPARAGARDRRGRGAEIAHAEDRQVRRGIPPGDLRVEHTSVGRSHAGILLPAK